jgi:UDP-N-acetylmuramate dehydrogenase
MIWYTNFENIVRLDEPLAPRTWFHLGGPARYFVEPRSHEELAEVVKRIHENNIPMYVLGGGANLLVRDQGVDGAVISLAHPAFKQVVIDDRMVRVGAGKDVLKLVLELAKTGLAGLECQAGIPGTVGGEIRMNAGGAFGDIGSSVAEVTVMDSFGKIFTRQRDDLVFAYRRSNINAKFILDALFELTPENPDRLGQRVKEIWMYKRNTQPLKDNSAGCIFRNPDGMSAGKLIDEAGLKGSTIGGAEISSHHANFIIARHGASSADVLALMELAKKTVREKTGIELESEVVIW